MPYTRNTWVNDTTPAISAVNLNRLTDELEWQAGQRSVAHTLPTWADGVVPAVSDPVPLNEMERVLQVVATSLGLSYTKTTWAAGWVPARNAANLNKMELQAVANRNAIDAGSQAASPLGYIFLPGNDNWPTAHRDEYKTIAGPYVGPEASLYPGKTIRYLSSISCTTVPGVSFGVTYAEANTNNWILYDGSGQITNAAYPGSYLGDAGDPGYRLRWCQNVEAMISGPGVDGFFGDDTPGWIQTVSGDRTPIEYPTDISWYNAIVGFCQYVGNYFHDPVRTRKYVSWNAGNWRAGDARSDNGDRDIDFWNAIGPYADGMWREYWMNPHVSPVPDKLRRVGGQWYEFWDEWRRLHPVCQNMGVDFLPIHSVYGYVYGLCSFLLDWDGQSGAYTWSGTALYEGPRDPWGQAHTDAVALGAPIADATKSGNVWTRQYAGGFVTVDTTLATASITVY